MIEQRWTHANRTYIWLWPIISQRDNLPRFINFEQPICPPPANIPIIKQWPPSKSRMFVSPCYRPSRLAQTSLNSMICGICPTAARPGALAGASAVALVWVSWFTSKQLRERTPENRQSVSTQNHRMKKKSHPTCSRESRKSVTFRTVMTANKPAQLFRQCSEKRSCASRILALLPTRPFRSDRVAVVCLIVIE